MGRAGGRRVRCCRPKEHSTDRGHRIRPEHSRRNLELGHDGLDVGVATHGSRMIAGPAAGRSWTAAVPIGHDGLSPDASLQRNSVSHRNPPRSCVTSERDPATRKVRCGRARQTTQASKIRQNSFPCRNPPSAARNSRTRGSRGDPVADLRAPRCGHKPSPPPRPRRRDGADSSQPSLRERAGSRDTVHRLGGPMSERVSVTLRDAGPRRRQRPSRRVRLLESERARSPERAELGEAWSSTNPHHSRSSTDRAPEARTECGEDARAGACRRTGHDLDHQPPVPHSRTMIRRRCRPVRPTTPS